MYRAHEMRKIHSTEIDSLENIIQIFQSPTAGLQYINFDNCVYLTHCKRY